MNTRVPPYDANLSGRTFDAEIERLRAQVALSWSVEQPRLSALGIVDGQHLLEAGCGPGFVTERLTTWLPSSLITGLDKDPRMLWLARQTLRDHKVDQRVELLEADVQATGLPSHVFDAVFSRYLFQHLGDPVAAAVELRRVLRPGGIHIVIDVDDAIWGLALPKFVEFEEWHRRRADLQSSRGGNRFRGRHLGRILHKAGYTRIRLDVFACNSDEVGLDAFGKLLDPGQFLPLVYEGLLTVAEYAKARMLFQQFLQSPETFVLSIGFIAYGENPL